jgi:serine kinase of HPr protein (carbohydrate metabolism regulator)
MRDAEGESASRHIHGNALILGEGGLLLRGPPGSGKSSLTLDLIAEAELRGAFARLVGDDRLQLMLCYGRIVAKPHPAIQGAIEIRGQGVVEAAFEPAAVIHLVVDLGDARPPRYPEGPQRTQLCGVDLPWLPIQSGDAAGARKIFSFFHALAVK